MAKLFLTVAQVRLLTILAGKHAVIRLLQDGTYSPWDKERRTAEKLVGMGLAHWTKAGEHGYIYNGLVITQKGEGYV